MVRYPLGLVARSMGAPTREKTMLQFILALIGGDDIRPW
jgi:hypothetical protein